MQDMEFEAAEWGFSWEQARIGESTSQGMVSLSRDGLILDIPFGNLLGISLTAVNLTESNPIEADWVYGFSRKGEHFALSKAHLRSASSSTPGGDSQTIGGEILLVGRNPFDPCAKVGSMAVSLTGLKEWIGESPFRARFDKETRAFKSLEYDLENEDTYNKELFSSDELSISVYHSFTASPLTVDGMSISHDCRLLFAFRGPRTIGESLDCVLSISRFLSFCLGFHAEIQHIWLSFVETKTKFQLFGNFPRGARPTERALRELPVPYKAIENSVDQAIETWLSAEGELDTACRMITSLISNSWDLPIDLKFLAASQALEALSRNDVDLESLPDGEYRRLSKTILNSIADEEAKSWIKDRMPGNRKGQKKLIGEMLDRYPDIADWLTPDRKGFLNSQTTMRNYYTHRYAADGNSDDYSIGENLVAHTEAIIVLCQGIIWENLGVDGERFIKLLSSSCFKHDAIMESRRIYGMPKE